MSWFTIWWITWPSPFIIRNWVIHHIELIWLLGLYLTCGYKIIDRGLKKMLRFINFLLQGFQKNIIRRFPHFHVLNLWVKFRWDLDQILWKHLPFLLGLHQIQFGTFLPLLENFEIILKRLILDGKLLNNIHQLCFIAFQVLYVLHILLGLVIAHLP